MPTEDLNDRLVKLAQEYVAMFQRVAGKPLVAVVLFGSVASREATPYSDIDLMNVAENLPQG